MDLKELEVLGDDVGNHWYYRSKADAMYSLLEGAGFEEILDVGAGSGFFSRHLLAHSPAARACCVDTSYPQDHDDTCAGKPVAYRRAIESSDADMVLMMDVLEHVDDDVGLLSEYVAKVKPGTTFFISVPAFQFLWSGHDVFLEHRRRYSLPQLETVVAASGLSKVASCYYFGAVFPLVAAMRLGGALFSRKADTQLKRHGAFTNRLLSAICREEIRFLKNNRLAGVTVFCVARKD